MAMWECVIVGAGPAGLSAAVYMGRFRRKTLLVDDQTGRWSYGQRNDNYLGFPKGVSARRLHALGLAQAERFGVVFLKACVSGIEQADAGGFVLSVNRRKIRARTVIWATGVRDHWPVFPGVRRLVGQRVFWCIVCDGWRTRDRAVLILAETDRSVKTVLQFLTYTPRLTVLAGPSAKISSRSRAKLAACGVPLVRGVIRSAVSGEKSVRVRLQDGTALRCHCIFSLYGSEPNTGLLRELPVGLEANGHVKIDDKNRTDLTGFFAAGDVSSKHSHQVASAVHEGATAAMAANHVLYPPHQRL